MTANHVPLTLHQADDPEKAGGKVCALTRLHRAGLPVPDSLVIPAGIADEKLPEAAAVILRWAETRAPHGLIARSSAINEDGRHHSFAGLYLSRFTPAHHPLLLTALHAVRASARSATAAAYARQRVAGYNPRMAVLVQPALRPALSGVVAAEVAGGECTTWRIEAVRGLAEPLVSGKQRGEVHCGSGDDRQPVIAADQQTVLLPATPMELLAPPGEWLVLDTLTGPVPAKVRSSGQGLVTLHLPHELTGIAVLPADHRAALLQYAARAAAALGVERVDVEWTISSSGTITIVQARPLTVPLAALAPCSGPAGPEDGWRGHPAVAGVAVGPAVHLADDAPPRGSVVICEALGPEAAGALLNSPAAIVATSGGPLSHTAILARELGTPCVTNVREVQSVAPGTMLRVDGSEGTVRPTAGLPAQRTAPLPSPASSGVVTTRLPATIPHDGRSATIVLHDPHAGSVTDLLTQIRAKTAPGTIGVLLLNEHGRPPTDTAPEFDTVDLPGIGWLLWPAGSSPVPERLVVLGPDGTVIHQRGTAWAGGTR
ncbi:PEP/pyruvate-binding domain-containing protein [Kitasatospora sp. NPDC086791]|uniref:PEP/pyruvate-binding domain-containing protein n=1 Tax=Kitasatospora sp. NPDC086791 TaxID=3155178 RepID=UPI00341F36A4